MSDTTILYKVMVLKMLSLSAVELTGNAFMVFFLEKNYTNFFTLQNVLGELVENSLIHEEKVHNNTLYTITDEGKNVLEQFENEISKTVLDDINTFLEEQKVELRKSTALLAEYYMTAEGDYAVRLRTRDEKKTIIDMTVVVKTEALAKAACKNWREKGMDCYGYLMELLTE